MSACLGHLEGTRLHPKKLRWSVNERLLHAYEQHPTENDVQHYLHLAHRHHCGIPPMQALVLSVGLMIFNLFAARLFALIVSGKITRFVVAAAAQNVNFARQVIGQQQLLLYCL